MELKHILLICIVLQILLLSNHCGIETTYTPNIISGDFRYYRTIVELKLMKRLNTKELFRLLSNHCGIETGQTKRHKDNHSALLSNHCGIETTPFQIRHYGREMLLSNHCGIETS